MQKNIFFLQGKTTRFGFIKNFGFFKPEPVG